MSYSQVFDLYEGRLIGYLGDLNLRGAMVIGDQAMEVDKKLTLSIQLPELPNPTATRLTLPGRVARYRSAHLPIAWSGLCRPGRGNARQTAARSAG